LYLAAVAAGTVIAGVVITMKEKGIAMPTMDNVKSVKSGLAATDTTSTASAPVATAPVTPVAAPQQFAPPVDNSGRSEF